MNSKREDSQQKSSGVFKGKAKDKRATKTNNKDTCSPSNSAHC